MDKVRLVNVKRTLLGASPPADFGVEGGKGGVGNGDEWVGGLVVLGREEVDTGGDNG